MENDEVNLKWMKEKIDHLEKGNKIYKFFCFFIRRKMTYEEYYLVLNKINEKHLNKEECKKRCLEEILHTYKYLNNKLPEGWEKYESK